MDTKTEEFRFERGANIFMEQMRLYGYLPTLSYREGAVRPYIVTWENAR